MVQAGMAPWQACVACWCALLLGTASGRVTPDFADAKKVLARRLPAPLILTRAVLPASGCYDAERVAVRPFGVAIRSVASCSWVPRL